MAQIGQAADVICLDPDLVRVLRETKLHVIQEPDRPIVEVEAIYVHAPKVVCFEPECDEASERRRVLEAFEREREKAGGAALPQKTRLPGRVRHLFRRAVRGGYVVPVAFLEPVLQDLRLHEFAAYHYEEKEPPASLFHKEPECAYTWEVVSKILPTTDWSLGGLLVDFTAAPMSVLLANYEAREWIARLLPLAAPLVNASVYPPEDSAVFKAATARMYDVTPDDVSFFPLVTDRADEWVACACRIGKGAVLILPECRDESAKAEVIRLLATELWKSVQEWLRTGNPEMRTQERVQETSETARSIEPRPKDRTGDLLESILGLADALERGANLQVTPYMKGLAFDLAWGVVGWHRSAETGLSEFDPSDPRDQRAMDRTKLELHYLTCLENQLTPIAESQYFLEDDRVSPDTIRELVAGLRALFEPNAIQSASPEEDGRDDPTTSSPPCANVVCLNPSVAGTLQKRRRQRTDNTQRPERAAKVKKADHEKEGPVETPVKLRDFIKRYCRDVSEKDLNALTDELQRRARHKKVKLPAHEGIWVRGKAKYFRPSDLKENWPTYRKEFPRLPELK